MIDTKLIVIDGLSGSGKTAIAKWLTSQLQQQDIKIWYLPKYDTTHPLWWYRYWDGNDYLTPDFENISIETFLETSLSKWKDIHNLTDNIFEGYEIRKLAIETSAGSWIDYRQRILNFLGLPILL